MFKDWQLALAAYNWGEGAVSRAIEKARARGEPTDYANLKMPAETAGYVPKLQAIKNIVMRPELFAMTLPEVPNLPFIATITKTRDIDVTVAARLAEMPVEEFIALNPSHNRPVIPGANNPTLVLPVDKLETFKQNLENQQDKPLSSWQGYLLKAGETLDRVASRFGMDLAALKSINGLSRKSRVGAGHTLLVPRRDAGADATLLPVAIDRPAVEAEEKSVRLSHVVRKGETLMAISRKFNLPVADIKRWNRLQADTVRPGQTLAIETVVAEKSAPHRGVAAAKAGPAVKGRRVARGPVVKKSRVALHARGPVRIARR
jgi:membrane-bound lytic murein transglycosylase D